MVKSKCIILWIIITLTIYSEIYRINAQESPALPSATVTLPLDLWSTPYPTATYSPLLATAVANGECLQSFSTFAYQGPLSIIEDQIAPSAPWQLEAIYPSDQFEEYDNYFYSPDVKIARSTDETQEIWLMGRIVTQGLTTTPIITIYLPKTKTWEVIPSEIENTDLFVIDLFVTEDGTIWGKVGREQNSSENIPVLSRFNQTTGRFEVAEGILEIPMIGQENFSSPEIVVDNEGIFWIFVDNDGLYRYDAITQTTEKQIDLVGFDVNYTALSPDDSIYFDSQSDTGNFRLAEDTLYQFLPETSEIVSVKLPNSIEQWPSYRGLLVDHSGRLWLGSIGYRDPDGIWQLVHPHPEEYFDIVDSGRISYVWAFPQPILESSDGILWFAKDLGSGGVLEGTAWYDPETGEGCMFTNEYTNIIEDSEAQLWLVANGALYKYPLN